MGHLVYMFDTWYICLNCSPTLPYDRLWLKLAFVGYVINAEFTHLFYFYQTYALINRARCPCEEIFVLTFKVYGLNGVRSMRLDCQNKYLPYGPKSRLIRALLYAYTNKTVYDEISVRALFIVFVCCPVHTPVRTPMHGLPLSQLDQRIRSIFQSVYNNTELLTDH